MTTVDILRQAHAVDAPDAILPTVLLAAGDPDMRLYLRSCLRGPAAAPARVLESADGLDALRLVRSGGVDLVIADMALPGLDGRRLRRALREDPALTRVAVLLLDAEATISGERAADDVLAGPFNGRRLLDALRALTRRPPSG